MLSTFAIAKLSSASLQRPIVLENVDCNSVDFSIGDEGLIRATASADDLRCLIAAAKMHAEFEMITFKPNNKLKLRFRIELVDIPRQEPAPQIAVWLKVRGTSHQ